MNKILTKSLASLVSIILILACSEIVLEKNISEKKIVLLSPNDGSTIKTLTPSFWWEEIEGASSYQIQIVSPSFHNPIRLFTDSMVTKNKFEMDLDTLQFQWRVRAVNGGYETGYTTSSFKIDSGSVLEDRALKLLAPSNNSFHKNNEIELKWEGVNDVEKYNLVVEGDTAIDTNLPASQTTQRIKFGANKSYSWKIIPINAPHYKESVTASFTTDNKVPSTPTLQQPSENANLSQESITFSWESLDENLEKNELVIYNEAGTSIIVTKEAGINNSIQAAKTELGKSGEKRQWAVKSIDKAGNEAVSSKRSFVIQ